MEELPQPPATQGKGRENWPLCPTEAWLPRPPAPWGNIIQTGCVSHFYTVSCHFVQFLVTGAHTRSVVYDPYRWNYSFIMYNWPWISPHFIFIYHYC